jgi:hypothetical protein
VIVINTGIAGAGFQQGTIYKPSKQKGGEMKRAAFLISFAVCVAMLLVPPSANAGTFLGKICFGFTGYTDLLMWNIEVVGEGSFITASVTGTNKERAMSGGGAVVGNDLKLVLNETSGSASTYAYQTHNITIDLTSPDFSGTDDIVFHRYDGTHLVLTAIPIHVIACP